MMFGLYVLVLHQVVLCVGSMFWTQEVAESIRSNTLQAYSKKCTDDLLDVSSCFICSVLSFVSPMSVSVFVLHT